MSTNKSEVELKWLVKQMPGKVSVETRPHWLILQTYLGGDWQACPVLQQLVSSQYTLTIDTWTGIKEVRVRQRQWIDPLRVVVASPTESKPQYILTLKSDGTLERDEYEILDVSEESICNLYKVLPVIGTTIRKRRFPLSLQDGEAKLILELDVFEAPSYGLVLAELEFDPVQHGGVTSDNLARLSQLSVQRLSEEQLSTTPVQLEDVTNDKRFKNRQLATSVVAIVHGQTLLNDEIWEALKSLATYADVSERFTDMRELMRKMVLLSQGAGRCLTAEERDMFEHAYKIIIGKHRDTLTTLDIACDDSDVPEHIRNLTTQYRAQVLQELTTQCHDIIQLLENSLLPYSHNDMTGQIFYLKLLGDNLRYLSTHTNDVHIGTRAIQYYERAYHLCIKTLSPMHLLRLGLVLNYSVGLFELSHDPQAASELAQATFDEAVVNLAKLADDASHDGDALHDATLIINLLKSNLSLWSEYL